MAISADLVLQAFINAGMLKGFKLETVEEEPGSHRGMHDRQTLTFPNGQNLVIDTFCSVSMENVSIVIDDAFNRAGIK